MQPVRWPQHRSRAQKRVSPDRYGGAVGWGCGGGRFAVGVVGGGGRWVRGRARAQVPAYADQGLDHGAPAEEYVLRAVELGLAGYFVAGFGFEVVAAGGGAGLGRHWWWWWRVDG